MCNQGLCLEVHQSLSPPALRGGGVEVMLIDEALTAALGVILLHNQKLPPMHRLHPAFFLALHPWHVEQDVTCQHTSHCKPSCP